jgi:catechol 2,3-dioxygenase-like lactoylglutathione lyase family enzyme
MPLPVLGLSHIAVQVRDLDASLRFYQTLFGSEISYRDDSMIELRTPRRQDALTLENSDDSEIGSQGSILHFGFRLAESIDADEIARLVAEAGGKVEDKGQFVPGEPYVFARDPDGYLIEIFFEP